MTRRQGQWGVIHSTWKVFKGVVEINLKTKLTTKSSVSKQQHVAMQKGGGTACKNCKH